jgi:hypothetical protein
VASDHVKEIELLRKLELDYLRAHHELTWTLLSKQTLLQWRLFTKYDAWPLNGALVSYVDISIRSLNMLEKIRLYDPQHTNLAHQFLREWRNLYHHELAILFEPFEGEIRLRSGDTAKKISLPASFYTYFVISQMQAVKTPKRGLKMFLDNFSIAAGANSDVQLSTLNGAITANHDLLLSAIKKAHRLKLESLPLLGVGLPAFLPDRACLNTVGETVLGDEIWLAPADTRVPPAPGASP